MNILCEVVTYHKAVNAALFLIKGESKIRLYLLSFPHILIYCYMGDDRNFERC